MKVLFAVSNEGISESIVKQYQKDYKEIISYKNVYYFNAILKEIQKDKSYDRIVISEDLEPFANNNYDTIDRFLFEKLDSISDEATNGEGTDIPIILIATDRRSKGDSILLKLFSIGIYNAILGADRNIEEVCKLINKPKSKKDAKIYYKIESDDAGYNPEDEESVNEVEVQNILTHYKKLGKNTERYVDSFNNIASQYTDKQLKVIISMLPLNVKAVLEAESPKYQELMTFGGNKKNRAVSSKPRSEYTPLGNIEDEIEKPSKKERKKKEPKVKAKKEQNIDDVSFDMLEKKKEESAPDKGFIVPNAFNSKNVKKMGDNIPSVEEAVKNLQIPEEDEEDIDLFGLADEESQTEVEDRFDEIMPEPEVEETEEVEEEPVQEEPIKKKRGRPKKVLTPEEQAELEAKKATPKKRGRPKKVVEQPTQVEEEPIDLFDLSNEEEELEDTDLDLFNLANDEEKDNIIDEIEDVYQETPSKEETKISSSPMQYTSMMQDDSSNLFAKDRKIVTFVGAEKNGTSFLVNNLAALFSENGIDTAILDLTKNKNSYYVYTNNDDTLRNLAIESIEKLKNGIAQGMPVNKYLTVYTALPTAYEDVEQDMQIILQTLTSKHSIVLIDADFDTPLKYFTASQEIYLVQSMDILTIQPLTTFLKELYTRQMLDPKKLKIVINKELKTKRLNAKIIMEAISNYNSPSMTAQVELFDSSKVKYCTIPYELENYARYLDCLAECRISTKGYTKIFMANLKSLSNMVYPLLNKIDYGTERKTKRIFGK